MKLILINILIMVVLGCVTLNTASADETQGAQLIIKVDAKSTQGACDKYCWQDAKVVGIISMTIDEAVPVNIRIAHYSWQEGIPEGVVTVGLRKYGTGNFNEWLLVDVLKGK